MLGWAWFEAGWVRLETRDVRVPGLPDELRGLRIAHLSDFHLGVPGRGSHAVERAAEWVAERQPDLTLVSFGLNDVWAGLDGLHDFASGMTEIIRRVRDHTESELILLTPNFMVTREGPGVEPTLQSLTRAAVDLQRGGVLAAYASAIRELGREHALPCADNYGAWEELAAQGADVNLLLANGLNHPTADAHAIAARLLMAIVMTAEATDESRDMTRPG